jgi:hypothetical protein
MSLHWKRKLKQPRANLFEVWLVMGLMHHSARS